MKVLVTGGTGFLGRFVVPRLARTHEVVCLVRDEGRGAALGTTLVRADLDDEGATRAAFAASGADALVNLASLGFGHAPSIVGAAEAAGVGRAVYVSTTGVTTTIAVASKQVRLDAEATIGRSTTPSTILRPTMIYGAPGDRNMERLLRALACTPLLPILGSSRLHQPVHVDDLAATVVAAVERDPSGRTYDVPGPEALRFEALIAIAARALGRRVRLLPLPSAPVVAALALIERVGRRPPLKAEQVLRLLEDKSFDPAAASADLGHDPRPFDDGIAQEARLLGLRP